MLRIGHRGAAGYEPENTLASFKKALELGVDMIELDVHCCKSGELVIAHDATISRISGLNAKISQMPLVDLKKLSFPSLEEALDCIDGNAIVNIELKGGGTSKLTADLIKKYIQKGWPKNKFLVSSLNFEELKSFLEEGLGVRAGLIIKLSNFLKTNSLTKRFNPYSIHLHKALVTKNLIKKIHLQKRRVFVWTVNKPKEIVLLKQMGVDGIFSDYPDRI